MFLQLFPGNFGKKLVFVFIVVLSAVACFAQNQALNVMYDQPAARWEETFPLGNGRLGMMPDCKTDTENIVLNDITLWSGSYQDANNYDAHIYLPEIRRLLRAGKNDEAQKVIDKNFICTGKGSAGTQYGCYQLLGNFTLHHIYASSPVATATSIQNYSRQLSLNNAVATCTFQKNGVTYKREYFTSFDGDVGVIRLTADRPGSISADLALDRPERFATHTSGQSILEMEGQLDNGTDGKGMKYLAKIEPVLKGGTITADAGQLHIRNATEVVIFISAGTNFKNPAYAAQTNNLLKAAVNGNSYQAIKAGHIRNYQQLFNRVSINLGSPVNSSVSTVQRMDSYHSNPGADPGFAALFFQFGRYLSICATRLGLLPPNLQGLWANQIQTPWNGDYHLDVNIQMNQWPVEVANLSEFNLPLAELVKGMVPQGEKSAKAYYNADGWVAHVITNVWGFTEPGESASWGITKSGSGWVCNNLWEHYAFTNDEKYLKDIYPVLKGSAQFYNSMLVADAKTGWLVTSPSSSPENSFYLPNGNQASVCEGPAIDNQIIRELFTNVIAAAKTLHIDTQFADTLSTKLNQLPPPGQVSKDGRLMEWLEDYKETEPTHRHVSHLYGLFPAPLITPSATPALAEACKKTLNVRGDDGPSWSIAYKILWWSRLQDGERAYKLLTQLLRPTIKTGMNYGAGGGIYPNLLSAGPPFQIDGNFGATAGIAEMLIQSHEGFINLLPAVPADWKKAGSFTGLKARGNFTVNTVWKDGQVTQYHVYSATPQQVKVKVNGQFLLVKTEQPVVY